MAHKSKKLQEGVFLLRRARSPVKSCKAGNSARRNYLTGSERPVVTCLEWHRRSNAEPRRIKGFNAPPLGAGESEQFAGWRRTQNGCPDFSRSGKYPLFFPMHN